MSDIAVMIGVVFTFYGAIITMIGAAGISYSKEEADILMTHLFYVGLALLVVAAGCFLLKEVAVLLLAGVVVMVCTYTIVKAFNKIHPEFNVMRNVKRALKEWLNA